MNNFAPSRQLLHTRHITCQGYLRTDGLLDIEGRLQDLSAHLAELPFHRVQAGEAVHDMRLALTVDTDLLIHHACAYTDAGATPVCGDITVAYAHLAGLRIGPGFKQAVRARLGGVSGCTHLTELVERMASTAIQVRFALTRVQQQAPQPATPPARRNSWVLDTCHAYRRDGEVVRLLGLVTDPPAAE